MTWQPIETAPRDSTTILARIEASFGGEGEDFWHSPEDYVAEVFWSEGNWTLAPEFLWHVKCWPRRWMPLPPIDVEDE